MATSSSQLPLPTPPRGPPGGAPAARHCGRPMIDVSTLFDRQLGCWTLDCPCCGYQIRAATVPATPELARGEPTSEPAGSEGKIAVMTGRLTAGEVLFHPRDSLSLVAAPAGTPGAVTGRTLARGVTWDAKKHAYRARVKTAEGNDAHLGLFDDPAAAARACELARAGRLAEAKALARGGGGKKRRS